MLTRRSWFVYGMLIALWVLLIGWQGGEHARARKAARAGLLQRAEGISKTLALTMRATSRGPFASQERIEAWLNGLVEQGEVISIKLFNAEGETLVSAGPAIDLPKDELPREGYWDEQAQTVTLMNLVDLGTNLIVNPPTNRPPPMMPPDGAGGPPPGDRGGRPFPDRDGPPPGPPPDFVPPGSVTTNLTNHVGMSNGVELANGGPIINTNGPRRGGRRRLSEEEFKALQEKKGTHGFIMVMSAQTLNSTLDKDIWLRAFIGLLATVSVAGYGLAWSNAGKTSELQIRLVRASELNSHLKEMNLAAAGLAHETRNPLNIVRGLAQMISKQEDTPPEIRIKSREIIDETDRVAAQLNEFINYSRPREVRRTAARLSSIMAEVVRALNYDIEEKKVQVQNFVEDLVIQADEQLLRQALFNLVINAIQAVPERGEIQLRSGKQNSTDVFIEIADNGPGVAPEQRGEIFKPYFTTHEEGTGLGLAVVQQIVLAHGWEIECLPNPPTGACFRITHVKLAARV